MEYLAMMYEELIDNEFFTREELDLITYMNGYNKTTFDLACRIRYGIDADDLLGWNDDDDDNK